MKFNIKTHGKAIDVFVIEQALIQIDPSAIIDIDRTNASLRVSTCLDDSELSSLITQVGFPVSTSDVQGVPSECCGGCGG
jgi:hypothetical protein